MTRTKPSLPAKRAFVIQFHGDARVEQGDCKGRVEHLVSYEAVRFNSLEELLAFMRRILSAQQQGKDKE